MPKRVCSFAFVTAVPLNISNGWLGLDFLQGNKSSVVFLVRSVLNSMYPLVYDVEIMIQVICRYYRIVRNAWYHQQKKIEFNISFELININEK